MPKTYDEVMAQVWKYIANRFLTFVENILIGAKLSEYHTGCRAFSRELLEWMFCVVQTLFILFWLLAVKVFQCPYLPVWETGSYIISLLQAGQSWCRRSLK